MSELQENVKPWLAPLAEGNWPALTDEARVALAAWATMFTMVSEFDHMDTVAIPLTERMDFRTNPAPRNNWRIWLGRYYDPMNVGPKNHFKFNALIDSVWCSIQTTGFAAGGFFIQTASVSPFKENDVTCDDIFGRLYDLRVIWPLGEIGLSPPDTVYSYEGFDWVSRYFAKRRNLAAFSHKPFR